MRILIDLQGAQNNSRTRGIGRYTLSFSKALARVAGPHRVFVLLNSLFPDTIADIKREFSGLLADTRFLVFDSPGPVDELNEANTWRRLAGEMLREYVIETLKPDAVIVPSLVEGAEDNTLTSLGWLPSAVPTAIVLHDLIPLTDPARYIGWAPANRWYMNKMQSMQRADVLLAVSESAAREAIEFLNIEPGRLRTIFAAADSSFTAGDSASTRFPELARRFGIERKYLMHSGAFEERKNFEGLVRAFAALPMALRSAHQLVLVCKIKDADRARMTSLGAELGLAPGDVIMTGFVPDADLVALYAHCHLFVFPSFHEGFGLPVLEAMCCGAPAIGSNATSIPEVVGRPDALFEPQSTQSIASLISKALTDDDFYKSLKVTAKQQAKRFDWEETARAAIAAVEEASSRRVGTDRTPAEMRQALVGGLAEISRSLSCDDVDLVELASCIERNDLAVARIKASAAFGGALSWRVEGPFDSTYSLALVNRESARALSDLGHEVILHSTEGPGDIEPNADFLERNPDLREMHDRVAARGGSVDVASRNLYPPRVHDMPGRLHMLHQYAWEETGFPAPWVANFNRHLDAVGCVSSHVENVLIDNGVHIPMVVTGNGVDHWERITPTPGFRVEARAFRFLHVSSCFPRKGIDALLEAYGRAFTDGDDVSLVVKTFENPHNEVHGLLAAQRAKHPQYPHVVVIEGDMSEADLKALYGACQVLVAPSRAEGFGLPLAEAMLSGLGVITTGWSGQLEFCNESTAWLVDYRFGRPETHFDLPESTWADPDVESLSRAMQDVRRAPHSEIVAKAQAGRALLLEKFKWSDVAARLVVAAQTLRAVPDPVVSTRIGWVTTWNTRCGIASYSEHLVAKMPAPVIVFAPDEPDLVREDGADCIRAWKSSKDDNAFDQLAVAIGQKHIDVLVVQFQYAFYNFRQFNEFIGGQIDGGRVVVVMMHSTADPGVQPDWNWSLTEIGPTLARCHRVLVHSIDDLNRLKRVGVVANVALFPHGVLDDAVTDSATTASARAARSHASGEAPPLISTYGYCLPHKGLIELVQAVASLRDAGTPVRLRLVNAEFPNPVSAKLIAELERVVAHHALGELVEAQHAFLSDAESLRLLQEADLVVFPYQATNESASGAVRYGLASGKPVAVTPVPIFDDLGRAVHRLPGTSPREIAAGLIAILEAIARRTDAAMAVTQAAASWRDTHAYSTLAVRLANILTAIARRARPSRMLFDGSSKQFRHGVGRIVGRSVVSDGTAGHLLFGPYLSLAPGRYRVRVAGAYNMPPGSAAYIDVVMAGSSEVLMGMDLTGSSSELVAEADFTVKRRCNDLEVRILVDKRAEFRIDRVEILPAGHATTIDRSAAPAQPRSSRMLATADS